MRVDDNQEGAPNYFPNSFGGPEPTPSGEKNEACCSYVTQAHAPYLDLHFPEKIITHDHLILYNTHHPLTFPLTAAEWHVDSATGDVTRHETGNEDNFSQCGDFFRNVLTTAEKERLTDNIAGNLSGAYLRTHLAQIESISSHRYLDWPRISHATVKHPLLRMTPFEPM